jgi:hypothetical protein
MIEPRHSVQLEASHRVPDGTRQPARNLWETVTCREESLVPVLMWLISAAGAEEPPADPPVIKFEVLTVTATKIERSSSSSRPR